MISKKISSYGLTLYLTISLMSSLAFIMIYGAHVLNPLYTGWLLDGKDLTQHYLGWQAYRIGKWNFPIGLTDVLAYPDKTSIIFTDSIPLLAVIFKILSPLLPRDFQYFGIWGIMCFILQGCLAGRIFKLYTKNKITIISSSLLVVISPVMLFRMFTHTSLAGQWILLFAIYPLFSYKNNYKDNNHIYGYIALLAFLATSIHLYFVLMCGIISIGICLLDFFNNKKISKSILLLIIYTFVAAATTWIWGGFSSAGAQYSYGGLGGFSMNLNSLFNPQGWSSIFQDLTLYTITQYEGFGYLGAGAIALLFLSILFITDEFDLKTFIKRYWKELISAIAIVLIITFIALSPAATFNGTLLYALMLPDSIYKLWGVFRASGRIVMVIVYVLIVSAVVILTKYKKRTTSIIIIACLLLQVYDIHMILNKKNAQFDCTTNHVSQLQSPIWDFIGNRKDIEHVVITFWDTEQDFYVLGEWALNHNKTLNSFAMAHPNPDALLQNVEGLLQNPEDNEIFIFKKNLDGIRYLKYNLNYYMADDYIIGYSNEMNSFSKMSTTESKKLEWSFGNNHYLQQGEDIDDGRIIYPGGLSFGPYWYIVAGNYKLSITGKNLTDNLNFSIYSNGGSIFHEYQLIECSNSNIVLKFQLDTDIEDMEIAFNNNSLNNILLEKISLSAWEEK